MSPTLDENATTSDPQVTRDHKAALLFGALQRAIQLDGLPAPISVTPPADLPAKLHMDFPAHVDAWAAHMSTTADLRPEILNSPRAWRCYFAVGVLEGLEVEVWACHELDEDGSLA